MSQNGSAKKGEGEIKAEFQLLFQRTTSALTESISNEQKMIENMIRVMKSKASEQTYEKKVEHTKQRINNFIDTYLEAADPKISDKNECYYRYEIRVYKGFNECKIMYSGEWEGEIDRYTFEIPDSLFDGNTKEEKDIIIELLNVGGYLKRFTIL